MIHLAHSNTSFFKKSLQGLTIGALLISTQASTVFAQTTAAPISSPTITVPPQDTQMSLTAIPPRLGEDYSLKAKPGETIQVTVRVKNSSSHVQSVKSLVEDFVIGDDGKQPIPVKEATPSQWSLAKWMTITPPINTLQPAESATINVLIEVPADAFPGGRYAMIMHEPTTLGESLGGGAASGISQRVGTLVYFVVEGDVYEEAHIRDVNVKSFFENGPVPFSYTIENRSDTHIRPNVQIEMRNMLGQKVDTLTAEPQNIFPTTKRSYDNNWDKTWGIGKYSGTIIANYGSSGKIVRETFSFWMFPIRLFLIVLFVLSFITGVFFLMKRKMKDSSSEKQKEIEMLEKKVKALESDKLNHFKDENN